MPIVYEPKEAHECSTPKESFCAGTIWQCDVCDQYWHCQKPTDLATITYWYKVSRFNAWRIKRRGVKIDNKTQKLDHDKRRARTTPNQVL